jgi:hypothetical protein
VKWSQFESFFAEVSAFPDAANYLLDTCHICLCTIAPKWLTSLPGTAFGNLTAVPGVHGSLVIGKSGIETTHHTKGDGPCHFPYLA